MKLLASILLLLQMTMFPPTGATIETGPIADDIYIVFSKYAELVDSDPSLNLSERNAKIDNMIGFWIFYVDEGNGHTVTKRDWNKFMRPFVTEHNNYVLADDAISPIAKSVYLERAYFLLNYAK